MGEAVVNVLNAIDALQDYEKQKAKGRNPVFYGKSIGIRKEELDYWNDQVCRYIL